MKRISFLIFLGLLIICQPVLAQVPDDSGEPISDPAPNDEPQYLPDETSTEPEPLPDTDTPSDSSTSETTPASADTSASDVKTEDSDQPLTGTLSDEDPDNQSEEKQKTKALFGEDEADPEDENGEAPLVSDYLLKFEFNTRAVFADKFTGIPYMEINYTTKVESPILVSSKKNQAEVKPDFSAEVTGTLSNNELYSCQLEIAMLDAKMQILTRHNKIEEKEDQPGKSELAVQLKFPKKPQEEWVSNCLASDGSKMKTQGDTESYNAMALESITPDLNGVLFEDYDPGDTAQVDLYAEPTELDDLDINNFISITGSGTLTIEYQGGGE